MIKSKKKDLELYLHIPFCVRKCYYCDFRSAPATETERQSYVEDLCEKIRACTELAKRYRLVTIFVGGGTPSLLTPAQTEAVFAAVYETFSVEKDAEITVEMNPGTVTREKLRAYRTLGVNRLSIGLQSVNDEELRALGRIHTWQDFLDTYRMARDTGFCNLNLDLISAIPGQTEKSWERTLRTAAGLSPEHISAYSLMIEEGTPLYEIYGNSGGQKEQGNVNGAYPPLPDEDTERRIYQNTKTILEEYGYHRYEISNYTKPGCECRHNLGYWERAEYLGIGDGAASLIENRRWVQGEEPQSLSVQEQMEEYLFLGLRKMDGISVEAFFRTFGTRIREIYGAVIDEMTEKKLLVQSGDRLRLTQRGIDVSNYVMSEFLL